MQLNKSKKNRLFLGVCGGIAEHFGWNANLLRIAFAVFTFLGSGAPAIVYLLLAFLMPKES
ncbi:MAG: PspC domain-containing protein [Bernardetiaceae bacterium]